MSMHAKEVLEELDAGLEVAKHLGSKTWSFDIEILKSWRETISDVVEMCEQGRQLREAIEMVEVTNGRCFVLWTKGKRGHVRHEPTIFTTAAAAITEGERQKDKGQIEDYNYSIVMEPLIDPEAVKPKMLLTDHTRDHSISL